MMTSDYNGEARSFCRDKKLAGAMHQERASPKHPEFRGLTFLRIGR